MLIYFSGTEKMPRAAVPSLRRLPLMFTFNEFRPGTKTSARDWQWFEQYVDAVAKLRRGPRK